MVSKKKRPPPALDPSDAVMKKSKVYDGAGTSGSSVTVANSKNKSTKKHSKSKEIEPAEEDFKVEDEEEPAGVAANAGRNDDVSFWPQGHLLELMKRMENNIPTKDNLRFDSRAEKLDWEKISFGEYSAEQCKDMWGKIQKRLRRFRLLKEVLEDAKGWVSKPWTHFYRSQKQNRHPDMPRRPLSTYMLFYVDKKDKVAHDNPGLEMTAVSKIIAYMYKNLSAKKKQKYIDMAARQRREYEEKMEQFYQDHPELIPKHEAKTATVDGPKKPTPPFRLFFEDKLNQHKNDTDFDRNALMEKCKEQWRTMADKKKVVWINWALEEEARYLEELKAYKSENPDFVPSNMKTVLTKEEKNLRERVAGKPEKPPNSGYSLFSRLMLVSPEIKQVAPKERMAQISRLWKVLSETQKKKYQEQVTHMLDQYKLEYATYLESLPEDKRMEELQNSQPKRRPPKAKAPLSPASDVGDAAKKNKSPKKKKEEQKKLDPRDVLYEGEPEPPPLNPLELFTKTFLSKAINGNPDIKKEEASHYWDMLPDAEKAKYRKRLNDIKAKYIEDYEKFLKSLSQEQLKDYSLKKARLKKDEEAPMVSSEESESEDESDSSEDTQTWRDAWKRKTEEPRQRGRKESESSSSDSESDSEDSSESNDSGADGKNNESEDSSSSVSDSE